jgi:outer membrane protein assembly factor BamB
MRRANLLLAVAVCGSLTGCRAIPLFGSPVSSPGRAPVELYSVDWWKPLVTPAPFESSPRERAGPTFDRETRRVVVLSRDGFVRALGQDGKSAWEFKTNGKFNASATISEGVVYVAGADGIVYALRLRDGELLWQYDAKEELGTSPVLEGGRVMVASLTDTLFVIDAKTGKWLWQYRRESPSGFTIHGASRPTVAGGTIFIGFADGHLLALRSDDGSVKWDKALSSEGQFIDVDTAPVLDENGRVYAASYKDGIFALDATTGDTLWHTATPGMTQLLHAGGTLVASGDQQLQAVSIATGQSLWSVTLKGKSARQPVLAQNFLVVPIHDSLVFVDPLTGKQRVAWDPGQGVSATPAWSGSHLYVISNLGYIYSMRLMGKRG